MNFILEGLREAIQNILSGDSEIWGAAFRSVWISLVAVTLSSIIGMPLGVLLGRKKFFGHRFLVQFFRTTMALPTVFVGLICFSLFARNGPLGPLEWLYTPSAIIVGECFLAIPIMVSLTHGSVYALDPRVGETAHTLGLNRLNRTWIYLHEAHTGIQLAFLTAYSRCVTELGIAMMVGGNLKGETRTLATATALETSKGEFGQGMAMGLMLLGVALGVTVLIGRLDAQEATS